MPFCFATANEEERARRWWECVLSPARSGTQEYLDQGMDPNCEMVELGTRATALWQACRWGDKPLFDLLINHPGIDIEKGWEGNGETLTPLWGALLSGNWDIALILVQKGANIHAKRMEYGQAQDILQYIVVERIGENNGYVEVMREVVLRGGDIHAPAQGFPTLLDFMASRKSERMKEWKSIMEEAFVERQAMMISSATPTLSITPSRRSL